ncbi:hypothetical protein RchiOBHm_Chr6g0271481 [Rosa chinensis]|uniref:Uncharacterized protein n=1 Tax=Rosa chinensis TaxID=74649 RepID=A0A2P6PR08_ROSCH|nr:hypothetical protein RchiOBHm_Chr6g0271481 [Rosa chinensis]
MCAFHLDPETCGDCKGERERELKKLLENFNSKRRYMILALIGEKGYG